MLLSGFDETSSSTSFELDELVTSIASAKIVKSQEWPTGTTVNCRRHTGSSVSIFHFRSNLTYEIEVDPIDHTWFLFQLEHFARVRLGSLELLVGPNSGGYVLPAGRTTAVDHPDGIRNLALRLDPEAVRRMASDLLDEPVDAPVVFEQPAPASRAFDEFVRGSVLLAAREFAEVDQSFRQRYWEMFESQFVLRLLLHGTHNYTNRFRRRAASGGPGRLAQVEQYIRDHWNEPLRLDDLARFAGTSAKTIYNDFLKHHDRTPHEFIKRLRLERAHELLSGNRDASVMMVALQCGFANFGHFANAYRAMFGELPSSTSRRNRP
jgi:AraC-like DNA-binding protein